MRKDLAPSSVAPRAMTLAAWRASGLSVTSVRMSVSREEHEFVLDTVSRSCRDGRITSLDHAGVACVRGRLVARREGDRHALPYLRHAVALAPADVTCRLALVAMLQRMGRHAEAAAAAGALRRTEHRVTLHLALARARLTAGRLAPAHRALAAAMRAAPDDARPLVLLGDLHQRQGRRDEAMRAWWRACVRAPRDATILRRIGRGHADRGEWAMALAMFTRGLEQRPGDLRLLTGAGQALRRLGEHRASHDVLRDALARDPRDIAAARELVCTLARDGDTECLASAWYSLGAALDEHDRLDEARAAFAVALQLQPGHVGARFARGNLHLKRAEYEHALPWYRAVLESAPDHHGAIYNLGWCHHLLGDYQSGWRAFKQQDLRGPYVRRYFTQPDWHGETLSGTLLLWSDQGLGDAIHFVRYLRLVRARVGRIVLQCGGPLASLVAQTDLADEIAERRGPVPAFDAQAPLSWLPGICATAPSTVPACTPYLRVPASLVNEWRGRLASSERELLVGLSWTGDETSRTARTRFVSLDAFEPLAGVGQGWRYVSLQHGRAAAALIAPPQGLAIESWHEESRSLLDTAAMIATLDLVITVDTMIAHLAGALARPVWTLIAHPADWRWGLEATTCPWYPTMRLFRQRTSGDWPGVMRDVRLALDEFRAGQVAAGRLAG